MSYNSKVRTYFNNILDLCREEGAKNKDDCIKLLDESAKINIDKEHAESISYTKSFLVLLADREVQDIKLAHYIFEDVFKEKD